MNKPLTMILGAIAILAAVWGAFTYLDQYALCEDVKKVDAKIDKTAQQAEEKHQKAMEIMTTNQMETMKIMNFGFFSIQLKDLDGRIDRQEQVVKKEPRNENAKQVLYELRQDRKKVVEQMDGLKEKK